jgi:hypothetical protein
MRSLSVTPSNRPRTRHPVQEMNSYDVHATNVNGHVGKFAFFIVITNAYWKNLKQET